jgi:hypothetical protein
MIGAIDLFDGRVESRVGRGVPRMLRMASTTVLIVLVAGVALAALGAHRSPSWTVDMTAVDPQEDISSTEAVEASLTYLELLELLLSVDRIAGVRLDNVDLRPTVALTSVAPRGDQSTVAHLRLTLESSDAGLLELVRIALGHPALAALDVLEYSSQIDGVSVSVTVSARLSTARILRERSDGDTIAALTTIVQGVGAEVISVRIPASSGDEQEILLSGAGTLYAIVAAVGRIEQEISSSGRVASVTLRRQADDLASLDVRFTPRDRQSVDGGDA